MCRCRACNKIMEPTDFTRQMTDEAIEAVFEDVLSELHIKELIDYNQTEEDICSNCRYKLFLSYCSVDKEYQFQEESDKLIAEDVARACHDLA